MKGKKMTNTKTEQNTTKIALRHYLGQIKHDWLLSVPTMLLSGIGNILVFYVPPLIIAALIQRLGDGKDFSVNDALPYVATFAGVWILGEALWRL